MKQLNGRHGLVPVILNLCILGCLCLVLPGCGSDSDDDPVTPSGTFAESYADRAVQDWLGVDYSNADSCDGESDSDGDGPLDAYDAVMIIKTWQRLGFDLPATTVQGLYANIYIAEDGFNRLYYEDTTQGGERLPFTYTVDHGLGPDDLVAAVQDDDAEGVTWTTLATDPDHPLLKGDLIFADHDKDDVWDFAAVYLGAWGDITHAALLVSDYYDAAVVTDLEANSVFQLDIAYGLSDVRRPAYAAMSAHQTTPDATAPTAFFSVEGPDGGDYTVTVTFSAGMTGFVGEDIILGNATLEGFTVYTVEAFTSFTRTNASVYKVTLTPVVEGDVTLTIPAGAALGSNGTANAEASYTISR